MECLFRARNVSRLLEYISKQSGKRALPPRVYIRVLTDRSLPNNGDNDDNDNDDNDDDK